MSVEERKREAIGIIATELGVPPESISEDTLLDIDAVAHIAMGLTMAFPGKAIGTNSSMTVGEILEQI